MTRMTCSMLIVLLSTALIGCGRNYRLPGHTEANLNHPPDIVLRESDRFEAVTTGIELMATIPPQMISSDPTIVEVQFDAETAWLIAHRVGSTTVKYGDSFMPRTNDDVENVGFVVTVVSTGSRAAFK